MAKAIRFTQPGGPEVMAYVDVEVGAPGPGQARIRQTACGLNYVDIYFRSGLYPQALPAGLGLEAAGVVEAVGEGVSHVRPGERVVYASAPPGAYADARLVQADRLVRLPDAISDDTAAAMMLRGLTVQYLFRRTYPLKPGDTILFHAAAGGVGLIACQWARALGVTMIGTVGSEEKAALARENGCTHTIDYNRENFVERVREITGGRGVGVVYDSIGRDTFLGSLDCLAPLGMMVSFGSASGPVPPFGLQELASRGSLFLTRPTIAAYTARRDDLASMADELFTMALAGHIAVPVRQRYALADAARAHRDLESRNTVGSSILVP